MFTEIDIKSWPRAEMFYYFSQMAPTGYSLSTQVDVTKMVEISRSKQIRFFPMYLWLVTRNLNRQPEFKCALKDGILGYYDTLTPLYAAWHNDTKTFSLMWTEFSDSFQDFYKMYLDNQDKYGDNRGILSRPCAPPENSYTVSEIPWLEFTHFAVHSYDNKAYYFPSVEAGKYRMVEGRYMMPISLTCHHATTDGWHISEFVKAMQKDLNMIDKLINDSFERQCEFKD